MMEAALIAYCGINCNICHSHLRKNNRCPGCRERKPGKLEKCVIKRCEERQTSESGYCYECRKFPCRRIRQIDERYRRNAEISNIGNLETIRDKGEAFLLKREEARWKCPQCGMVMGNNGICLSCGYGKLKKTPWVPIPLERITPEALIAPCGMNCALCSNFLSMKYDLRKTGVMKAYCNGCRPRGKNCAFMKRSCDLIGEGKIAFCYDCKDFPCGRLKRLDNRYSTKYHMSMIENLTFIKEKGMEKFLEKEAKKWKCPECGGVVCCHNGVCYSCELEKLKNKKKKYSWADD